MASQGHRFLQILFIMKVNDKFRSISPYFILFSRFMTNIVLSTILTIKINQRSASFAKEVSLRILLHAGEKAWKWWIHPDFEIQSRCHLKSKTVVPKKRTDILHFFKEKRILIRKDLEIECSNDFQFGEKSQKSRGYDRMTSCVTAKHLNPLNHQVTGSK